MYMVMTVDVRHHEPLSGHAVELCLTLGGDFRCIDPAAKRACEESGQGKERARLSVDETWCICQRSPSRERQVQPYRWDVAMTLEALYGIVPSWRVCH
jgi:hypothetical protein